MASFNKIILLILLGMTPFSFSSRAQDLSGGGEANPDLKTNRQSLESWQSKRFGMFIHWGPVALRGTEIGWSRGREVPFEAYDRLYLDFNPKNFDAGEWVSLAKAAGMKYLVIVSKHHDGFVMWDSQTTDYDIMATPYGKDILDELSRECRKQGILFGTYYSICDWRHPDYPVEHNRQERKKNADMARYISYMKAQIRELVEKYQTKILWFDGEWEDPWTHEMGMDLYRYVRNLDDEIIINNRVDKGRRGMEGLSASSRFAGDFATPEQQVGRYDPVTPWESCITLCTQWAWKPDDDMKSLEECIETLVLTAGGDGNLLLNIGPKPDGTIEKRQAERLKEIGLWLEKFGDSVYGTRGGPIEPHDWGVSTRLDNRIFLHVLNAGSNIKFNDFPYEILSAELLNFDLEIDYYLNNQELILFLPEIPEQVTDRVVKLVVRE